MKYNTFVSLIKDLPTTEKIASSKTGEYREQKPKKGGKLYQAERKYKLNLRALEF